MTRFVVRRILQSIPAVVLSSVVIFGIIHAIPGDPAQILAGPEAQADEIAAVRAEWGLDRSLPVQYVTWLGNVLQGDLGSSYINGLPVTTLMWQRIPATVELALAAMLIAVVVGVTFGTIAAVRAGKPEDYATTSFGSLMIAVPNFWFGIVAILVFGLWLGWLPTGGRPSAADGMFDSIRFLILPAITLSINACASLALFTRSAMIDALREDYIGTALVKGVSQARIVVRHALKNALIPIMTISGIDLGRMLGGAIVIETVFAWPGVGRLLVSSIAQRDYSVVQGVLLLFAVAFVVVNLIVDLLYGAADPRVRAHEKAN